MKYILLILLSLPVFSLPIVNESVATNSIYTIYPDHEDPHLYYISPNFMQVARDEEGYPLFSYSEWRKKKRGDDYATIQAIFTVKNYSKKLESAQKTVREYDPKARFALTPFSKSKIIFENSLKNFVEDHSCSHPAG